jgi:hypothetical protein
VELCVLDELEVLSVEHNCLTTVTPTLMQLSRLQVRRVVMAFCHLAVSGLRMQG